MPEGKECDQTAVDDDPPVWWHGADATLTVSHLQAQRILREFGYGQRAIMFERRPDPQPAASLVREPEPAVESAVKAGPCPVRTMRWLLGWLTPDRP